MDWISIALGAWLAAIVVSILWNRASDSEKAILGEYPSGARRRLFLPGPWKGLFRPEDVPRLGGLRRKSLLTLALVVLSPLMLLYVRTAPPEGAGRQAAVTVPGTTQAPPGALETLPGGKTGKGGAEVVPGAGGEGAAGAPAERTGSRTVVGEGLVDPDVPMTLEESRRPTRLYGTARVRPVYDEATGEVNGVRVRKVTPGSFWERIGARSGDIIIQFNGRSVDNPQATVDLMNQISRGSTLRLLVRDNEGRARILNFSTPE